MGASQIDIIRTVKVNGAVVFSTADEQVNPTGGTAVYSPTVVPAVANQPVAIPIDLAKLVALSIQSSQPVTIGVNAVDAQQTAAISGSPTGGTFTLSGSSPSAWTTAAIAYNATAAQVAAAVQAAILAVSGGAGAVISGAGGPLPSSAATLTFGGTAGAQPVATMTAASGLTGGTPSIAVAPAVAGAAPAQTIAVGANVALDWTLQSGYFACPLAESVSSISITNLANVAATLNIVVGLSA